MGVAGPLTIETTWQVISKWFDEQVIEFRKNGEFIWLRSGFNMGDGGVALIYFDIWYAPGLIRAAFIHQANDLKWYVESYFGPTASQIYNNLLKDGLATIESVKVKVVEPKPKKVEVKERIEVIEPEIKAVIEIKIEPKPEPRPKVVVPKDIPLPDSWLIPPMKRKKLPRQKPNEKYLEFGELEYLNDYELSEIRERLEHGTSYSRIA